MPVLGYDDMGGEDDIKEFPKEILEDINELVYVCGFAVWKNDIGTDCLGPLLFEEKNIPKLFSNLLRKYGKLKFRYIYGSYLIKFKTLLVGYQLFKKDFEEFERVLKTAKDEEEFCTLAGLS